MAPLLNWPLHGIIAGACRNTPNLPGRVHRRFLHFVLVPQVAYYGEPSMAPAIFLRAYVQATTEEFRLSSEAPQIDAKNPAGE